MIVLEKQSRGQKTGEAGNNPLHTLDKGKAKQSDISTHARTLLSQRIRERIGSTRVEDNLLSSQIFYLVINLKE